MGKYGRYDHRRTVEKTTDPHPIWRGIGCLMIIIIPIFSYALAAVTVDVGLNAKWPLPYTLLGTPQFPDIFWTYGPLTALAIPLAKIDNLYAILFIALFYMVLLGGISSIVYAVVYRFIGPPRYGPLDLPPPNVKTKRYKR